MRTAKAFLASASVVIWGSFLQCSTAEEYVPLDTPQTFQSQLKPCPASCAGQKPENWTVYSDFDRLAVCNQPLLLDFSIYNDVLNPNTDTKLRVCTDGDANDTTNALLEEELSAQKTPRDEPKCVVATESSKVPVQVSSYGSDTSNQTAFLVALEKVQKHLADKRNCATKVLFGYSNGAIIGVYSGRAFNKATASSVIDSVSDQISKTAPGSILAQLCGEGRNANHVFGVLASTNIGDVQKAVRSWNEAKCVSNVGTTETRDLPVFEERSELIPITDNSTSSKHTLNARADCRTTTVVAGDSCGALVSRCGISTSDFTKYNSDPKLCSTLAPGQRVCCSAGTLPDVRPKPGADGTCATHLVKSGDTCSSLAAANGLKLVDIDTFNNGSSGTWGWNGCYNLMAGMNICLSKGNPPMPAPVSNALCGPTKPGSQPPGKGQNLTSLNPCPLNACCNIWGQCGINSDFCVLKRGPSNNPGTSPPGKNGCVSNCGLDIVNTSKKPPNYGRVGYYESWSWSRPCLRMNARDANTLGYSIIHWAFANIGPDYTVVINDTYKQWNQFKKIPDVKKVVSFGGWGYSTEPATYNILRQAMDPANRDKFAKNVVDFLNREGLDGADFDWEYPGAPDIPGVPPGLASDGPNYLKFLEIIKPKMPQGKTLSIAAPASYWYLKAFPIDKMAKTIDYIVYMTYDLHGQWDAGNKWATEGCPEGNCLRSHVNITETNIALAMITKAGVSTNQIFVGESSYGRSFKMAKAGCDGPMCRYLGDGTNSLAAKGRCTGTSGYIANAEIKAIIELQETPIKSWYDEKTDTDYLVYNQTEWVAFMSTDTKKKRRDSWRSKNFAGTIDWAVDLQRFSNADDFTNPDSQSGDDLPDTEPLPPCTASYNTLEELDAALAGILEHCKAQYTLNVLDKLLKGALDGYDGLLRDGYDNSFNTYANAVVGSAGKQVEKFYMDNGNKYWNCVVTETIYCCSACRSDWSQPEVDKNCRYCEDYDCREDVCNPDLGCTTEFRYKNFTQPCPPDYSQRGEWNSDPEHIRYMQSVYYTWQSGKQEKFWADLLTETGITEENIEFKDIHYWECAPTDKDCRHQHWDYGVPSPKGYSKEDVTNPKEVVSKGQNELHGLGPQLSGIVKDMRMNSFRGVADDIIDAVSLPIFMVVEAVENMKQVQEIAHDIDEQKRKAIIMAFLSALLFFVPIVGEVVGSIAAMAGVARIIALLGVAGEVAMGVYDIVDDKDNAPMAIFGIILAPLALLDVVKVGKAADWRRAMKTDDLAKLGKVVEGRMGTIKKVTGMCMLGTDNLPNSPDGMKRALANIVTEPVCALYP
ncbi:killer toxin alpha/beta [Pseudomassariella vexata]|uniref:chitinase n=1 Tax=Pseudomassariella vexata TaxID=1141098 RepID=A0A1Y2DF15_9PEZI|nr:killer toxin alpha/beta [Pseudomassariella vexata]ORY57858.1 killer toxin alpha/beta [Pseudomassariella vexata]